MYRFSIITIKISMTFSTELIKIILCFQIIKSGFTLHHSKCMTSGSGICGCF